MRVNCHKRARWVVPSSAVCAAVPWSDPMRCSVHCWRIAGSLTLCRVDASGMVSWHWRNQWEAKNRSRVSDNTHSHVEHSDATPACHCCTIRCLLSHANNNLTLPWTLSCVRACGHMASITA